MIYTILKNFYWLVIENSSSRKNSKISSIYMKFLSRQTKSTRRDHWKHLVYVGHETPKQEWVWSSWASPIMSSSRILTIFKVNESWIYIYVCVCVYIYVYIYIYIFFFLATPQGLQDLSSPTRGQTWPPAVKAQSPNHWTAREFLSIYS